MKTSFGTLLVKTTFLNLYDFKFFFPKKQFEYGVLKNFFLKI